MMDVAANTGGRAAAAALRICDTGDLVLLENQWNENTSSLWVLLAATSPNSDRCLRWILEERIQNHQDEESVVAGIAHALAARVGAGSEDPTIILASQRLQAWSRSFDTE